MLKKTKIQPKKYNFYVDWPSLLLIGMGCLLIHTAACSKGSTQLGSALALPTINQLPSHANQTSLAVSGTRTSNSEVWMIDSVTQQKTQLAPSQNSNTWQGTLHLTEGTNTFVLVAKRATGSSNNSLPYTVMVKTISPNIPTVQISYGVYLNNQPQVSYTLNGTKDANTNIQINGATAVSLNANTLWSSNVDIANGNNMFAIVSLDDYGNSSPTLNINLRGTQIIGPSIDSASYQPYSNQTAQTLYGSKAADTDLWMVVNGGAPVQIGFTTSTTWSIALTLPVQGNNQIEIYATQANQTGQSASAVANVFLKTTAPAAPLITSPIITGALPDTAASALQIAGQLPDDGYLCVSQTLNGPCIAVSTNLGGNFNVGVPLQDATQTNNNGNNDLYIMARDLAGNQSGVVHTTIYKIAPPQISNFVPTDHSIFSSTGSLTASLTATANAADSNHAGANIAAVSICLDLTDCIQATSSNTTYSSVFMNTFTNESIHTITMTVSNAIGLQVVQTNQFVYSNGQPWWLSNDGSTQNSAAPQTAYDSLGNLHVVWQDSCTAQMPNTCKVTPIGSVAPDIFYAKRSTDGTWSSLIVVSSTGPDDGHSNTPSIAVDINNNVHIVWSDDGAINGKPASYGIVHRFISPTGNLSPISVVGSPILYVNDVNPSLSADKQQALVHASFTHQTSPPNRYDIAYSQFYNNSWSTALLLTASNPNVVAELPMVAAAASGHAQVVWQQGNGPDIYLTEVANATTQGFATTQVTSLSSLPEFKSSAYRPTLLVDSNNRAWVFWDDSVPYKNQNSRNIWSRRYVNGQPDASDGLSGNGYILVSNTSNGQIAENAAVSMSVDGTYLGVVWSQATGTRSADIWGKVGTLALALNNNKIVVNPDGNYSSAPAVAVDTFGNLQVVWVDNGALDGKPAGIDGIFFTYVAGN